MNRRNFLAGAGAVGAAAMLPATEARAALPAAKTAAEPGCSWVVYAMGGMLFLRPPGGDPVVVGRNDGSNYYSITLGEAVSWLPIRMLSPTKPDETDGVQDDEDQR